MTSDIDALRKVRFFEELTDDDLSRVAKVGQRRSYAPGDTLVERDSDRGGLFVILSGTAEVGVGGAVHDLAPGDFFGEMALLGHTRRSASVMAKEPVEALVIETIYFDPFLIQNPSVAVAILHGVVERLREVQDRVDRAGTA
ncbi:MAG: cyclic nucleotide-binding domain-containing protein [Actinomycetota bacterium]|nr:cyclic nucleotide-binding domain-containing protein [Actinomycetota bacterium]